MWVCMLPNEPEVSSSDSSNECGFGNQRGSIPFGGADAAAPAAGKEGNPLSGQQRGMIVQECLHRRSHVPEPDRIADKDNIIFVKTLD